MINAWESRATAECVVVEANSFSFSETKAGRKLQKKQNKEKNSQVPQDP